MMYLLNAKKKVNHFFKDDIISKNLKKFAIFILLVLGYLSTRQIIFEHPLSYKIGSFFKGLEAGFSFVFVAFILILAFVHAYKRRKAETLAGLAFNHSILRLLAVVYLYERFCSDLICFYPDKYVKYLDILIAAIIFLYDYLLICKAQVDESPSTSETIYFSDKEMSANGNDLFGFKMPAIRLVESIESGKYERSFVIGINAPWGRGKSSFLSFVKNEMAKDSYNNKFKVIEFNPWNHIGDDSAQQRYFSLLEYSLKDDYNGFSDDISEYSLLLSDGINKLDILKRFLYHKSDPQFKLKEINQNLQKNNKRYIVIIDDLDRIHGNELREIVKMIRTTADFKNFFYILCYDRKYVNQIFDSDISGRDSKYFDKIVELEISLPYYDFSDIINSAIIDEFAIKISDNLNKAKEMAEYLRLFLEDRFVGDFVSSYWSYRVPNVRFELYKHISSPRVIKKAFNVFLYGYSLLKENVVVEELLVLSILKVRYPIEWECFVSDSTYFEVGLQSTLDEAKLDSKITTNVDFNELIKILFKSTNFDDTQSIRRTNYRNQYFKFGIGKSVYSNEQLKKHILNPSFDNLVTEAKNPEFADKFGDFNEKYLTRLIDNAVEYSENDLREVVKILLSPILGDYFDLINSAITELNKKNPLISTIVNSYFISGDFGREVINKFFKNLMYTYVNRMRFDDFIWNEIIENKTWIAILDEIVKYNQGDLLIDFYTYHARLIKQNDVSKYFINNYLVRLQEDVSFKILFLENCFGIRGNKFYPNILFSIVIADLQKARLRMQFFDNIKFTSMASWRLFKALNTLPDMEGYYQNLEIVDIHSTREFSLVNYIGDFELPNIPVPGIELNDVFLGEYNAFIESFKEPYPTMIPYVIAHAFPITEQEARSGGAYIFKRTITLSETWDKQFTFGKIYGVCDDTAMISINGRTVGKYEFGQQKAVDIFTDVLDDVNSSKKIEIVVTVENINMDGPNIDGTLNPYWFIFSLQLG